MVTLLIVLLVYNAIVIFWFAARFARLYFKRFIVNLHVVNYKIRKEHKGKD